jgi:hypothetical protein
MSTKAAGRLSVALSICAFLVGCGGGSTESPGASQKGADKAADIRANLGKLADKDRKLAEEQTFCAVLDENRLGAMGVPVKLMVKDQAVFLCCKGCREEALADPDKTLAKVKELKAKRGGSRSK